MDKTESPKFPGTENRQRPDYQAVPQKCGKEAERPFSRSKTIKQTQGLWQEAEALKSTAMNLQSFKKPKTARKRSVEDKFEHFITNKYILVFNCHKKFNI